LYRYTAASAAAAAAAAAAEDDSDSHHPAVVAARERGRAAAAAKFRYALRVADAIDTSFGPDADDSGDFSGGGGGAGVGVVGGSAMTAARELLHGGHEVGAVQVESSRPIA
jgi:hypothetical protein